MGAYSNGQKVKAVKTIHSTTGSAWSGHTGKIVEATWDGYKIRWDHDGHHSRLAKDDEIEAA